MIGLIPKTETIPKSVEDLGEVTWNNILYTKVRGTFRQKYADNYSRMVGVHQENNLTRIFADPITITSLMPNETMAELRDQASTKTNQKSNRGKAYKFSSILNRSKILEVSSAKFNGYLKWMVDNSKIPSFTQDESDSIKLKLGIQT